MDIVDELKDSYSFLGDPLHRKAWEEIERLRVALGVSRVKYLEQNNEIERLRDALWDEEKEALREALQQCVTVLEVRQKRFEDEAAWRGSLKAQRKARSVAVSTGLMLNEIRKHVKSTLGEKE